MSGDQLDLDEVIALCEVARDESEQTWHDRQDAIWQLLDVDGTVPALVAEVRRLRAQVERVEGATANMRERGWRYEADKIDRALNP